MSNSRIVSDSNSQRQFEPCFKVQSYSYHKKYTEASPGLCRDPSVGGNAEHCLLLKLDCHTSSPVFSSNAFQNIDEGIFYRLDFFLNLYSDNITTLTALFELFTIKKILGLGISKVLAHKKCWSFLPVLP